MDRARKVLKDLHPKYCNDTANVTFGDTPGDFGRTDFWSGDITLSKEFETELTPEQREKLLETMAHEFQHSNDSLSEKARTNLEDLLNMPGRHEEIYRNSINLNPEAYQRMNP